MDLGSPKRNENRTLDSVSPSDTPARDAAKPTVPEPVLPRLRIEPCVSKISREMRDCHLLGPAAKSGATVGGS
jgi:hypothetical protein